MKNSFIVLTSLLAIYIACKPSKLIPPDKDLGQKIANGAIILDVRTTEEYEGGHIAGSVNISLGTIRERYTELDSSKTYITTCSHGMRSVKVKNLLKERGFQHVYNGGAWKELEKVMLEQRKK